MRRFANIKNRLKGSNIFRRIQTLFANIKFVRLTYYHAILLGFGAFLFLLAFIFFNSPIFAIRNVEVINSKMPEFEHLDPAKVQSVVLEKYFNTNLINLDGVKVANEIKLESTFVKEAFVTKHPRDKVVIEIIERKPSLLIAAFKNCVLLDEQSFVMVKIEGEFPDLNGCDEVAPKYEVPIMRSTQITAQFNVGEVSSYYEIEEIVKVIKVLDKQGYRVKDGFFEEKKFIFSTYSEQQVVIGSDENIDEQLKRFIVLSSNGEVLNSKFKAVDLRFERPVLSQ